MLVCVRFPGPGGAAPLEQRPRSYSLNAFSSGPGFRIVIHATVCAQPLRPDYSHSDSMPAQPENPSTILTSTKRTFLTRQILLLSSRLTVPLSESSSTSSTTTLPTTTTTPLLEKINKKITSHNRLHFPLQTQRHVLEQIESIYWRDVLASGLPITKSETLVGKDIDFTTSEGVQSLESGWDGVVLPNPDTTAQPGKGASTQDQRFAALHKTLHARITRRDHLRKKARALKRLRKQLEPFENSKENIQANLVGAGNKEIEAEMARMRVLLVRAEGQIRERQEERLRLLTEDGERVDGVEGRRQTHMRNDLDRLQSVLELG